MLYIYLLLSFVLCFIFTPMVRSVSMRKGWMAYPKKDRWHKKPTALLGGIAIYIGMAIPLLIISDFSTIMPAFSKVHAHVVSPSISAVLLIGITLLFVLGLLDDFIHIKPHTKLVGQIMAASFVSFIGIRLNWFSSFTIDTIVTIVWIVGITNAFNLLDNMDGLCAGTGFVAAIFLALIYTGGFNEGAYSAVIIAGALGAFLIYNFNPASIFMGDCGSLIIGFALSIICIYYPEAGSGNPISIYAIPILILIVPILDTTLVTLIRLLSGRRASQGGKDHTSHRLVLMGFTEKNAVLFLFGIGFISGIAALFVHNSDRLSSPSVIIPVLLSIVLMGIYLSQLRIYPEKEFSLLRDKTFTPVLIELTYKRQLVLVILDFCLISFAYYLSYRLRFDNMDFPFYFKVFLKSLPAIFVCKFIAFFAIGVYRGVWGYMSSNDVLVYLKASTLATILSITVVTVVFRFENFSKGIFLIDWFLTTGFLLGTRGFFRLFNDIMKRKTLFGDSIIIYGAGRGGEILLREILNNSKLAVKPIGFIDDDKMKTGKKLQGYPIFGTVHDIGKVADKHTINGVLISFRKQNPQKLEIARDFCRTNDIYIRKFSIQLEDMDLR